MIEVNENPDKGILALRISGKLTQEELDNLVPSLEKYSSSSDHPHLLMIMEDFKGWEDAATLWKDLQMDSKYIGHFDRIAVVGEKKWQEWGTKLVDPITSEELKFFSIEQAEDAWNWAEDKDH